MCRKWMTKFQWVILLACLNTIAHANMVYEIDGSPFATADAPLPEYIKPPREKLIMVDPQQHVWGAYTAKGKLVRWGIATTGATHCRDTGKECRTDVGSFRIHSLGDQGCVSYKYPLPDGGAPMPYCMYFNGGEAIHGSDDVQFANASHGCVRVHVSDAKWLRYQFVEGPSASNKYQGTRVVIKSY